MKNFAAPRFPGFAAFAVTAVTPVSVHLSFSPCFISLLDLKFLGVGGPKLHLQRGQKYARGVCYFNSVPFYSSIVLQY